MGVIVSFDFAAFSAAYPEFAYIGAPTATNYFNMATVLHANDGSGPVPNATIQTTLLNALVAHLASIYSGVQGEEPSPLVGRIANATQGSVSVGMQNDYAPGTVQWYQQTKYGSMYWAMTSAYRRALYVPGPFRNMNPWGGRGGRPYFPLPGPN